MFFCGAIIWLLKNQVYALSKLDSKELYKMQVLLKYTKPTSQHYFEKDFSKSNIDQKKIYILPRVVTVDNRIRVFQYKMLNNILFLNKMFFKFRIVSQSLCSFCNSVEETPFHDFHDCTHIQSLGINFRHTLSRTCHSMFNTTECHVWLYRFLTGKLCYYKSFATYI